VQRLYDIFEKYFKSYKISTFFVCYFRFISFSIQATMPYRNTADTLVGRIRKYFGLDQAALALYLGVSPALVQHLENGRRRLTGDIFTTLQPLAAQVAAAEAAHGPAATSALTLPGSTPAPDEAKLDFRRRVCQQQLARVEKELSALGQQAQTAQHWVQALPALLQAVADTPDPDPERDVWRLGWLQRQARPLLPEAATRWRLLCARRAALKAEIAALNGLPTEGT
jgi:transcriptional regulator with XRE-family HTH domain